MNDLTRRDTPVLQSDVDDLVKEIAKDVAKAVAHHIKTMYPKAVEATTPNMLISVQGCVYNEIMAAIAITEEGEIERRLAERRKHRREINKLYRAHR